MVRCSGFRAAVSAGATGADAAGSTRTGCLNCSSRSAVGRVALESDGLGIVKKTVQHFVERHTWKVLIRRLLTPTIDEIVEQHSEYFVQAVLIGSISTLSRVVESQQ